MSDIAWAAGFFDGEGWSNKATIHQKSGWTGHYLRIGITQKDVRPLHRFHRAVSGWGSINGALRQFRASVSFARLADSPGTVAPDDADNAPEDLADAGPELTAPSAIKTPEAPPSSDAPPSNGKTETVRTTQTVQITYSPHEWALLQGKFPMSNDDWDAMIDVLKAMKRGLVTPADPKN